MKTKISVDFEISISEPLIQKPPPDVFYKKRVLKNFTKFTGKHKSLFFNKVAGKKKRPWCRHFPVNFTKFLRTSFFTKHLREAASAKNILNILTYFTKHDTNFGISTI